MKSAALYDPYLDTLGGGEKHILSILKVLNAEDIDINIYWDKNLQTELETRFNLRFNSRLLFLPNSFKTKNPLKTLKTLKTFDYFFYVTDGSYFFSPAKKNFIFAMVPNKNLYRKSLLNQLKMLNCKFISNSRFTQSWLMNLGIKSYLIYPYISHDFTDLNLNSLKKEGFIISIGRFYTHLHAKQQSALIKWFNKLQQKNNSFKKFKLILAGGLKEEDKPYFKELEAITNKNPNIELRSNLTFSHLLELYKKSSYYVHMTGYGIDENKNPEKVEHLGMTPLEAMASGNITFCFNAGGPKELIKDGETGYLFNNEEELTNKLIEISKNLNQQNKIKLTAQQFVKDNFSYQVFKKRVKEVIL